MMGGDLVIRGQGGNPSELLIALSPLITGSPYVLPDWTCDLGMEHNSGLR